MRGKTVLAHMQSLNICSCVKVKRHNPYGKTSHVVPNLLEHNFTGVRLKKKLITDVTEFRVGNEKLYLSPIMDLAN